MENLSKLSPYEVIGNLAKLNTAISIYNQIEANDIRNLAEIQFCQLYDWFTEHNISILYIEQTKSYTLDATQEGLLQFDSGIA